MLYISPVQEDVVGGGFTKQVAQWAASIEETNSVLAGQLMGDVNDVQRSWIPGLRQAEAGGAWSAREGGGHLGAGFRRRKRLVVGYNGNQEIAIYAKFTLSADYVKLDWVVAHPSARINCGPGTAPLRSILAFMATVGQALTQPVKLNADLHDEENLIRKYSESGWEVSGPGDGSGKEMELAVENLERPTTASADYKYQLQGVHWVFSGEHDLAAYLGDGTL